MRTKPWEPVHARYIAQIVGKGVELYSQLPTCVAEMPLPDMAHGKVRPTPAPTSLLPLQSLCYTQHLCVRCISERAARVLCEGEKRSGGRWWCWETRTGSCKTSSRSSKTTATPPPATSAPTLHTLPFFMPT